MKILISKHIAVNCKKLPSLQLRSTNFVGVLLSAVRKCAFENIQCNVMAEQDWLILRNKRS